VDALIIGPVVLALLSAVTFLLFKILRALQWLFRTRMAEVRTVVGKQAEQLQARSYLCNRLGLAESSMPPVGGWAGSADFLLLLAEHVLLNKPEVVVEFGSGVSTLVLRRCLQLNGAGRLISFDHDPLFARITAARAQALGLEASVQCVDLVHTRGFAGRWYDTPALPDRIDLLVIDGPPISLHPETRAGAASLFHKLAPKGAIFLDDASRPGERAVGKLWRESHPEIAFTDISTEKGTLIGVRAA
jgi:predicted O-methyltransferase YrrM